MIDPIEQSLNRYLKEQDDLQAYDTALDAKQEEIYDLTVRQFMKLLDMRLLEINLDRDTLALLVEEEAERQVRTQQDDPDEPQEPDDAYWDRPI